MTGFTKGKNGKVNGWIQTLWNATERPDLRPEQVYMIGVRPKCSKGPHLHMKRRGLFFCVKGEAEIIVGNAPNPTEYKRHYMNAASEPLLVPPGCPAEIRCVGPRQAWLINMPSPAWTKEDPDDWPVEGWNPLCTPSTTTA